MMLYTMRENFLLIAIWVLTIFISVTSYIALRNVFPSYQELILGHTLYAIPALPNAFLHIVGFYQGDIPQTNLFFWALCLLYWAALGCAHYWYFEENREFKYIAVISLFLLPSSVKWLYYAVSLMNAKQLL